LPKKQFLSLARLTVFLIGWIHRQADVAGQSCVFLRKNTHIYCIVQVQIPVSKKNCSPADVAPHLSVADAASPLMIPISAGDAEIFFGKY
jgi:hypothetical protein